MTVNAIDLDAITEALSRKADIDLVNCTQDQMTTISKEYFTKLFAPSDRYVNLTLPSSGGTVTAPADGYIAFSKIASAAAQWLGLRCTDTYLASLTWAGTGSGNYANCFIPVRKGETVVVEYAVAGDTKWFRFVYAEGEK